MFRSRSVLSLLICAPLLLASACGDNDDLATGSDPTLQQNCGATDYKAADPANHASQDLRVAAQIRIAEAIEPALSDPSLAPAKFTEVETIYTTTAELSTKVQGRADEHLADATAAAAVGPKMDADITAAIAAGKAATTELEIDIAKEIIDKTLIRFYYLSVYHELVEGSRGTYDEAYGYLGVGPSASATKYSIAAVAARRDANNGTTYAADLVAALLEGSCALDTALATSGTESIDWQSDPAYRTAVQRLDRLMQEVLAASVGHEFFEPLTAFEAGEAQVRVYEGAYYFAAIEQAMLAMGGTAAADAATIRAELDAALAAIEAEPSTWNKDTFDSIGIRDKVAAAFGLTING